MVTSPSPICVVIGSTPLCAPVCDPVSGLLFQQPPDGRSGRLPIVLEDLAPPKPSASGLTELRSSTNLPPKACTNGVPQYGVSHPRQSSRRRGLRQERARK